MQNPILAILLILLTITLVNTDLMIEMATNFSAQVTTACATAENPHAVALPNTCRHQARSLKTIILESVL